MMSDPKRSRGYRNRNPGNIDHQATNKWQGLANPPLEPPPGNGGKARFCVFVSHAYGIRALAMLLQTYQDRHNLRTVRTIIDRWAPPVENATTAYVLAVSRKMDNQPDDLVDLHSYDQMRPMVEAIIQHELGGQPYTPAEIDEGLRLAGLIDPSVTRSGSARVAVGTAAAGFGTAAVLETVATVAPHADQIGDLIRALGPWVVAVVVIAASIWFVLQRAKERREIVG